MLKYLTNRVFHRLLTLKKTIMDEFVLLFRLDILTKEKQPSPELLQVYMKQYQDWVGGIAAQNKFVGGTGLSTEGRVLKYNNVVTDGPFAEIKESIAGYTIIKALDFDDAVTMAAGCPILKGEGNSVEVRRVQNPK
jgi:hypothetical protein